MLFSKSGYYRIKAITKQAKAEIRDVLSDGTIKIALTAAPEKNKANQELLAFLMREIKPRPQALRLVSGHTSPLKIVDIQF